MKRLLSPLTGLLFFLRRSYSYHLPTIQKTGVVYMKSRSASNLQKSLAPLYLPKTPAQTTYAQVLKDPSVKIVLGVGPAGCGKTLFACTRAIEDLQNGVVQKIILTRPLISVDEESVGFLPGTMSQKMDPWTRPIFDIFSEYYSTTDIQSMVNRGVIEVSPLAYMRGRTFKRAFIIADEMQNSSPNQMLMLTTRLGEHTKLAITGDLKQSDRPSNGLGDFIRRFRAYSDHESADIQLVELGNEDILRSPIVAKIMDMYDPFSNRAPSSPSSSSPSPTSPSSSSPSPSSISAGTYKNSDAALIPAHHVSKYSS